MISQLHSPVGKDSSHVAQALIKLFAVSSHKYYLDNNVPLFCIASCHVRTAGSTELWKLQIFSLLHNRYVATMMSYRH